MKNWYPGDRGEDMYNDPFEEYIKQSEPDKKYKGYIWSTAIGLQAVDGLETSEKLKKIAIENIEGNISITDAQRQIESYYESKPKKSEYDRTEEADKVSVRIAAILSEKSFSFSPSEYIGIHKKLFTGIYKHAGKIRDYNITKKEWVLDGATVLYGNATELRETLEYDFSQEKKFSYKGLTTDEIISHLAYFISGLWQIHIFGEGNTRTTAVFFIKYLRSLGYDATNDIFAESAWYFRNALVRANYTNLKENVYETTIYLEKFIRNLLFNENNELKNRYLHIKYRFEDDNPSIEEKNIVNGDESSAIGDENPAIEQMIKELKFNIQTKTNIRKLYDKVGVQEVFGRKDISTICEIPYSTAGDLISKMRKSEIVEEVKGIGKGKYRFCL